MKLPSLELLSEVFGEEVEHVDSALSYFEIESSSLLGIKINGIHRYWSIYEIAHKCKEWALKKHELAIFSGSEGFQSSWFEAKVYETRDYKLFQIRSEAGLTELDAIFKACEWIRKKLIKENA